MTRRHLAVVGLSHPFRGGISHYSTLLVRALRERHDVEFITFRRQYPALLFPGKTQYDTSARPLIEPNEPLLDSMNPLSWQRTAAAINRQAPDLIILQWWQPFFGPVLGTLTRLLAGPLRERVCFICHNVLPHEAAPLQSALARYAFRSARFFIVHSEEDRQRLGNLLPDRLIRRGVHPTYSPFGELASHRREEARLALAIPDSAEVVLFFGLIRPYKGLRHLIEAMSEVVAKRDCMLLIAGEFYEAKRPYLELIARCGLERSVRVLDRYIPNEEVALYFAAADVAVLPYVSATQSGIVQTAFGLDTPVITTRVGGLPEAVDDGKTGLLVDPGDPSQLAKAIVRYFEAGLAEPFRKEIRRQKARFDWSRELEHIEEFLARVRSPSGPWGR